MRAIALAVMLVGFMLEHAISGQPKLSGAVQVYGVIHILAFYVCLVMGW